jgi:hypothetical protein
MLQNGVCLEMLQHSKAVNGISCISPLKHFQKQDLFSGKATFLFGVIVHVLV